MTLNDAILAATGGPTINDGLRAYYLANGAVAGALPDLERQFLLANGGVSSSNQDMWMQILGAAGYTGTLNDMLYQFWLEGGALFDPSKLFANGEVGVYYDPSDIERYMSPLGPELVTNGGFDSGTGWALTGTTISGSNLVFSSATSGSQAIQSGVYPLTAGITYEITVEITGYVTGILSVLGGPPSASAPQSNGTHKLYSVSAGTDDRIILRATNTCTFNVAIVSVKELTAISTATLFQDSAGTIPVTAAGQPVGLMLDQSQGLELGPELVVNGDFSDGDAGWTLGTGVTVNNSACDFVSVANDLGLFRDVGAVAGAWYEVTFDVSNYVAGDIYLVWPFQAAQFTPTNRTYRFIGRSTDSRVAIRAITTAATLTIDNISVKLLAGNHASQPTATKRPILQQAPFGGVRNLLTWTEDLTNGAWIKQSTTVSANAITAPDGTLSADKFVATNTAATTRGAYQSVAAQPSVCTASIYCKAAEYDKVVLQELGTAIFGATFDLTAGTGELVAGNTGNISYDITNVGDGWFRCSVTYNPAGVAMAFLAVGYPTGATVVGGGNSYAGDGVSGAYFWGAQLELGSTATPYQKVTNQYTVTEEGVPSVWSTKSDGIDDFASTADIDFSGTDKVSAWCGVTKLDDTSRLPFEFSPTVSGSQGSFALEATNKFTAYSKGAGGVPAGAATAIHTGIKTSVLACYSSITTPIISIQEDGGIPATSTASQGTGNFGNYPLYIASRAGTQLFFSGNLYPIVIAGALYDQATIDSMNKWTAKKTGVTLP